MMQRFLKKRPASQLDPDTSSSESGASTVTSAASSEGDRRRSDSEAATSNKRRKSGDCRRLWHSEWETTYLVSYDSKTDICTCFEMNRIDTVKKCNLQRHCECMHPDTKEWSDEKRKFLYSRQNKS